MAPSGQMFTPHNLGVFIPILVVVVILILRNRRPRALRIERLWIRPAIFLLLMATTLYTAPPPLSAQSAALLAAAVIVGGCLGWLRGRSMRIDVHPETHDITASATPIGVIFILVLILARVAVRGAALQNATAIGVSAAAMLDALVLMAVSMIVAQGLEMWLRASRLLAQAQAAKAMGTPGREPIVR